MANRLNILPDPAFRELQGALEERLERIGASVRAQEFASLADPLMRQVLERSFAEAGAHEGTVWLPDPEGEHLVPAYNSGPDAAQLVGRFKQPLNAGLICMVFASEQPFVENDMAKNSRQSKLLDAQLRVQTCAMIAVPFSFLRACRGVVSCVQLQRPGSPGPAPPGFRPEHLARVEFGVALFSQLLEFRLLSRALGWPSEGS